MKSFALAAALVLALGGSNAFAQAPDQTKSVESTTASGVGVRIAFFDPQVAFQQCGEGKAGLARLNALTQRKQTENADRQTQLQANQQKLQAGAGVLSNDARTQLEKAIEKAQVELQRFQQDAQAEINSLQQEVQNEFLARLHVVIGQVATEKGLHIVFNVAEPAIAWITPNLDVTSDVVKKLDATSKPAVLPHD